MELEGVNGNASYTLREADAAAIRDVFELSQAIKAVEKVDDMLGEARYMLEFLKRSEARSSAATE